VHGSDCASEYRVRTSKSSVDKQCSSHLYGLLVLFSSIYSCLCLCIDFTSVYGLHVLCTCRYQGLFKFLKAVCCHSFMLGKVPSLHISSASQLSITVTRDAQLKKRKGLEVSVTITEISTLGPWQGSISWWRVCGGV
jgi:hypothetical protein